MKDHISFQSDDEPDGPECSRIHVLAAGNLDYYLSVSEGERLPITPSFRASTSGSKNYLLTFLVAAMWKLGNKDFKGAARAARAFSDQCEEIS